MALGWWQRSTASHVHRGGLGQGWLSEVPNLANGPVAVLQSWGGEGQWGSECSWFTGVVSVAHWGAN